jgi:hypothetical protein
MPYGVTTRRPRSTMLVVWYRNYQKLWLLFWYMKHQFFTAIACAPQLWHLCTVFQARLVLDGIVGPCSAVRVSPPGRIGIHSQFPEVCSQLVFFCLCERLISVYLLRLYSSPNGSLDIRSGAAFQTNGFGTKHGNSAHKPGDWAEWTETLRDFPAVFRENVGTVSQKAVIPLFIFFCHRTAGLYTFLTKTTLCIC